VEQIQKAAANLHHPFYVVLVQDLPSLNSLQQKDARKLEYGGEGDREDIAAAYAIDKLAEDWAQMYPNIFKADTASVFLLSYNPRKFRLLAAPDWKSKLGLEKKALEPYTQRFVEAAKGSPKRPGVGIINLMQKLDAYVFEQTDPERIKAREEAARQAREAQILKEARSSLDEQIMLLAEALDPEETPLNYLPPDVASYQSLLEKARSVRETDNPKLMGPLAEEMTPSVKILTDFVSDKRSAAFWAGFGVVLQVLLILAFLTGLGFYLFRRRREYIELRTRFQNRVVAWEQAVANAAGQYVASYAERDGIVAMTDVKGRTKELWDTTTTEIDSIWIGVKALEGHVKTCKALASKGSYLRMGIIQVALDKLYCDFEFDTGTLNKDELFGGETKKIKIDPSKLQGSLSARFKAVQANWDTLRKAADARISVAQELFPHTGMTAILEKAQQAGIPSVWYQDHPLAGDDTADRTVWETAESLRWEDPIAYLDRIQELLGQERQVQKRIDRLAADLMLLQTAQENVCVPELTTKLPSAEDPAITLIQARQAAQNIPGVLVSACCGTGNDTMAIEAALPIVYAAIKEAHSLFDKAQGQIEVVQIAIKDAPRKMEELQEVLPTLTEQETTCQRLVKEAVAQYEQGSDLQTLLEKVTEQREKAQKSLTKVKILLQEGQHLAAMRKAEQGLREAATALSLCNDITRGHRDLANQRKAFENQLAGMERTRRAAQDKIRRYGGDTPLSDFEAPNLRKGSALNYLVLTAALTLQERNWEKSAQKVQRSYEAEQARVQAEEARREAELRRRANEEAERHRRESYSSYHSSSSSSWGGGSSSFGGSFGGGGSSSSGGSW
jgi:uncharacterized membrane protein YgcG